MKQTQWTTATATAAGAGPQDRASRRTWRDVRWVRVLVLLSLLLAWQAVTSLGLVSPRVLASPSTVAQTGLELLASGELPRHLWVSLGRVSRGLALGVSAGVTLALVAGLFRLGEDVLDAPIQMLRTLPVLALVPLFILWFGIGETPKVALVSLGTFFPVYLNTYAGIRSVDNKLVEAAATLGLGRLGLVAHVVLPGALPSALVGLRHSMGVAWLVLVISEQINATAGIGYLMTNAREFLRTDIIVLGLVIYALLGLSTDLFVRWLERNVLGWRAVFAGR
ncbi:ABC transporter permease [Sorangium sp. So ce131]|uniref:ABC transporter permease n=1 Tax=Sorangium sp. So ce131 TaxID=3133282 RepID=UPI003F617F9C